MRHLFELNNVDTFSKRENLMNQFMFYNRHVVVNGNMFYDDELFMAGLWYTADLFDSSGIVIPFHIWKTRGVSVSKYMLWRSLVSKIRSINISYENVNYMYTHTKVVHINEKYVDIESTPTRELYAHLVKQQLDTPTSYAKYSQYVDQLTEIEKKNMFILPRICTQDNELKEFQYKVLHRYLPTNTLLIKMNRIETKTCTFCNLYDETIIHLLYECLCVKDIWFGIQRVLEYILCEPVNLTCIDVIFGYRLDQLGKKSNEINAIILNTKMYIWKCKLRSLTPTFEDYKSFVNNRVVYEKCLVKYNEVLCQRA